jgi:hypothetical protein
MTYRAARPVGIYVTLEIRTIAGPSRTEQWVLSGGTREQVQVCARRRRGRGTLDGLRGLGSGRANARWGSG